MIKTFQCPTCGEAWEIWRQLSKNMPAAISCSKCGHMAYPQDGFATIILFKGEGWTPKGDYIAKDLRDVKGVPDYIGDMLD